MKTGVAYMGHHNPKHIETDIRDMRRLQLDDVLLACQENDFVHFTGKLKFTPQIAKDNGLRPIAIFWGALNLFGGGRSSQFLLDHPAGFQVGRDGVQRSAGCYMNPLCRTRIKEMIAEVAAAGFEGYFVDEPTPLHSCFCPSCRASYADWYGGNLAGASAEAQEQFRQRCVLDYVTDISDYCKASHPRLETMCCLMPVDESAWECTAAIATLDNLGTDIYWVNNENDVEKMAPLIRKLDGICKQQGKIHHEWLQCWKVRAGKEQRILEQGKILVRERPAALYVWAWQGQIGVTESCDDPALAWSRACDVLRMAREA